MKAFACIILFDVVLKNSYSWELYEKFNLFLKNEETVGKHCNNITNSGPHRFGLIDLCNEVRKYLNNNYNNLCLHFIYWLYDKIHRWKNSSIRVSKNSSNKETYKALQIIIEALKKNSHPYFYYDENELKEWNEEKLLHDYIMNFDSVVINYCSKGNNKNRLFENYINLLKTIYPEHKKYCCPWMSNRCLKYFSCDEMYNPDNFFSQLTCNGDSSHDIKVNNKYDWIYKGEHKYFRCKEIEKDNETTFNSCSIFPSKLTANNDISQRQGKNKIGGYRSSERGINILMQVTEQSTQNKEVCESHMVKYNSGKCREPDVRETGTIGFKAFNTDAKKMISFLLRKNSGIAMDSKFTHIGVSALLIIGVFSILFIYYKLTPVGSIIRNRIFQKGKGINNDSDHVGAYAMGNVKSEVQKKTSTPAPKSANVNNQRRRTHIAYHP
ncbi:variable surface protein [Plasmodium gonderi]|uniref:Variable surface protein n=1 Tax=Plasmodium gonderi TaxID=77519 RepID=A0A1Y1JN77_PLAGO|nr:variable surface protein [Plasmodium gonderi]GAW83939.1 variable surface protein [Plasmodium gonderi]